MKHKILLLGCLALGLFSCKNDEEEDSYWIESAETYREALSQFQFTCGTPEINTDSAYFTGKINGQEVCYTTSGSNEYYRKDGLLNNVFLSSGTTPSYRSLIKVSYYSFGIATDEFTEGRIDVLTPGFPQLTSRFQIVESSLQLGALPLASDKISQLEGHTVNIYFGYEVEDAPDPKPFYYINLTNAFGDQEGSTLEVTQLNKVETDSTTIYNFTLAINCRLYWQRDENEMEYFGDLEDGLFQTSITLDK